MMQNTRRKTYHRTAQNCNGIFSGITSWSLGNYIFIKLLLITVLLTALSACDHDERISLGLPSLNANPFATFRDIPGITEQEIADIELLQNKYRSFIYGMPPTTEAFFVNDEVRGFSALFCEWLTSLFHINFRTAIFSWGDMIAGLERTDIDFTGDLMATNERRAVYFMTDDIAERSLALFRTADAPPLSLIASSRPLRYAFLNNSAAFPHVTSASEYPFEPVFVNDSLEAYETLKSGKADAFLSVAITEGSFLAYRDIVNETFFPLVYNSVSLSTQNPELAPVINVVQKALKHNSTRRYLAELYQSGSLEYHRYKLFNQLSAEELAYIENNKVIKIAAEIDNYPISFYNIHEHVWQGVAHEVLAEVEKLTGLSFEISNPPNTSWTAVLGMLERGDVALLTELVHTDERKERFLWPNKAIMEDRAVLLSRFEYPNITFSDVLNVRVGVIRNTAYAESFRRWFPNHEYILEYDSITQILDALESGEIEMMMGRVNQFLNIVNYREIMGYKINVIFDSYFKTSFGLHKNEPVLCSLLDKSLRLIDTESISINWAHKTHDYRYKLIEARLPWLISAITFLLITLALILLLFNRTRNQEKMLAKHVAEETSTLTAILNGTPDHIFCKDLNSKYTRCNDSFRDYFNFQESVIGKFGAEALGLSSDTELFHKTMDNKVFTEGKTVISELFVSSPDGKRTLFELIKSPLIQNGKVTGLVGMARDITMRKAAEDEAKRASASAMKAYAEAENASEAKSRFIANMSHEMRTPMNVIVGLTDLMLEEESVPATIKDTFKKINIAGNTLMGLINDVLDISKVEAGKLDLKPVQYELASLLNDIVTLNTIRIEEKPIKFILDINEDLPQSLFGDDLRIKQVLNNLLSNAFKYTKEGSVTLGVSCQPGDSVTGAGTVWLSFSIRDTGIGIRAKDIARLFTDYNQVDTHANRTIEGTGLGLSITKKFVELMDGRITAQSEFGKGTAFYATIRQGIVTDQVIGNETAENLRNFRYSEKKGQASERLVRSDLSYARVLVVDDFPINLDVAAGMLRKYKMQVDCVLSGQESIDLIAAGEPVYDAIFMDHMMPGMDGITATKSIRALDTKYAQNIPIIALTANVVAGNEQLFIENGFNAYLPKPFSVASLDSIVQRWVRDKSKE
jgi:PAS domain S-box-containing protein